MAKKPHMNLVFIGHVDHGKSTTVGRIMYDTGNLTKEQYRKLEEEAKASEAGASFSFAFMMDRLEEERERGVTIDVMHEEFETDTKKFTIIDAPGHSDFVKNMITGTSQADAGVLVVSGKPSDGVQEQTREHAQLAKTLGVGQLVVSINKMDAADYDEGQYKKVKKEVEKLLKGIGYDTSEMHFVPTSAFEGDNIAEKSDNTPWYDGKTLVDALDDFKETKKPVDKPLRVPIQDVYTIKGVGTVPVGRVETGVLKKGQKVTVMPGDQTGEVKQIEMHHKEIEEAEPGDNIGFNLKGVDKRYLKRGTVVGTPDNKPTVAEEFKARVIVLSHPSAITKGYQPVLHCHTAQVACNITNIDKKLNPKTGEVKEENPDYIKQGDAAVVTMKPTQPMVVESGKDFPELSSFAMRDMGKTIAAGKIMEVTKKK
ncbi:MAG: translation elongation factor EF-1 subunit alpha [archaeon]